LPPSIGAILCFFSGNLIISIITAEVTGLAAIFYMSFGAMIAGYGFQIIMAIRSYINGGPCWNNLNLVVQNKVKGINVVMFFI